MNIIQRLALNYLTGKVKEKLKEAEKMEKKPWYLSKTVLAGVVSFILSAYQIASVVLAPVFGWTLPPIPDWVIAAAGAVLGPIIVYGRTTAVKAIK